VCEPRSLSSAPPNPDVSANAATALGLSPIGRGMINADEVDALGHMRAEFLFGKISDSVTHFEAAFPDHWQALRENAPLTRSGAVLEARILTRQWPRAGAGYAIHSGLKAASETVRTLVHWVLDPATGQPLWTMEAVACVMDLTKRKLHRVSTAEVARLQGLVIEGLRA
jgi:acyl-CoA thioester hydrolase